MAPDGTPTAMAVDARPPGYPAEYERVVTLADSRTVAVRPIVPADAPALAEAIRTADPETLHRRFLGAAPRLSESRLQRLTTVDYQSRFALVAVDPEFGRGVGICRYEPVEPGVAEFAVAVDPLWRRVGLATVLVELLVRAAASHEVLRVQSVSLAENIPVMHLEALAGPAGRQVIREGFAEFTFELDRLQPEAGPTEVGPDEAGTDEELAATEPPVSHTGKHTARSC